MSAVSPNPLLSEPRQFQVPVPRPFMVERGHAAAVGLDHWVAYEYAKVRRLYSRLGLADRTEIEFFAGGHEINGQGTFEFLKKQLKWPK